MKQKQQKSLWILTEERPKVEVLKTILTKISVDKGLCAFIDKIRVLPILINDKFTFVYKVIGFECNKVQDIFIKTISSTSSLVDFLIFYQEKEPTIKDKPIYAIEETKTADSESRNTGVYQRCSKFVFVKYYYPNAIQIMLYSLKIPQTKNFSDTYIFGTRLLLTLGVEILGKELNKSIFKPFTSIDDIIAFKANMGGAKKGNVPILLTKYSDKIEISGKLLKSGSLAHDPNIGAFSLIAKALRKLGWQQRIVITLHGLQQSQVGKRNKFLQIANKLDIELNGLTIPQTKLNPSYWKYDKQGEKLGTIFIHLVVENFTTGFSIFENHAGCEKSYFTTKKGEPIVLEKYSDKTKYKAGDKSKIVHIPDLILIDFDRTEVINIEGKKYKFRQKGINELNNYDYIEKYYIEKHYPNFSIIRTVVLYGSTENKIIEIEIGFLLNENGGLILGINAPQLFQEAITNLLDFWN